MPIRVNIRNPQDKDQQVITYQNAKLLEFRIQIEALFGIPLEEQLLLHMEGVAPRLINEDEETDMKDLKSLAILDNTDIMINRIDPEELKKQQAINAQRKAQESKAKEAEAANELNIQTGNLVSVLVENDDEEGVNRYCNTYL